MRQRRHSDSNHRFSSNSPLSRDRSPVRSQPDPSMLLDSRRRLEQQAYDGRNFVPNNYIQQLSRSQECENLVKNRCFSGSNRFGEPESDRFEQRGLVESGEYGGEDRKASFLGIERRRAESSLKFQWDSLLVDNDSKCIDTAKRDNLGGFYCSSGEVPVQSVGGPSGYFNHRMKMDPTGSCGARNYGVGSGGVVYASSSSTTSPLGQFEVRGRRSSIVDSIVQKIEGHSDVDSVIPFVNNNITGADAHFVVKEKDLDYRNLNFVSRTRTDVLEKIDRHNHIYDNTVLVNNMMSEKRVLLENGTFFGRDENQLGSSSFNLMRMRTEVTDDVNNDIACRNNTMNRRRMSFDNGTSFGQDDRDFDDRSFGFMKMSSAIVEKIDRNSIIDHDFPSGNNLMDGKRLILANDNTHEDDDIFDRRSLNLSPESLQFVDEHGFERHDYSASSYGNDFERIPIYHEENLSTRSTSQKLVTPEEAFKVRLKRKHHLDMKKGIDNQRTMFSCDWTAFDQVIDSSSGDGSWTNEDIEQFAMLQNARHGQYEDRCAEMMFDEVAIRRNDISEGLSPNYLLLLEQRNSSYPVKPSDVKKRLGPLPSIKQRLGPAPIVRRSLRPAPQVKKKIPWVKINGEKALENLEQNLDIQVPKPSKMKIQRQQKTEPSEDTVEFMQQVQIAFLKFSRVLNENFGTQQKYLEQGRAGTFKCFICGSFKEFIDPSSLAQHAFTSCKVGLRSEHLGFGKALCVLMGWNSEMLPNGRWSRQILPAAEATLSKEDLVIWPPVVLIHNNPMPNDELYKHMIVSIEGLRDILRGMGCRQGITGICHGKSADQNIMVVTFSGTFSGFREAESIDKLLREKKHGRQEFQQISAKNCQEAPRAPIDKVESVLYGYMGIAEDLHKLDNGTKKRCVVKSKKEIAAIADALLSCR